MPAKKTTTKKTTAKKPTKRTTVRAKSSGPKLVRMAKRPQMESFKLARPQTPFLTIAITRQTLYWSIIAVAVLALGIWIVYLQGKVNDIYDTIEANNIRNSNSFVTPQESKKLDK